MTDLPTFKVPISKHKFSTEKLGENETIGSSVKYFPGDPYSPYSYARTNESMPIIPVISISYDEAKEILEKYTNAFNLTSIYTYGLPLDTTVEKNFEGKTTPFDRIVGLLKTSVHSSTH